MSTTVAGVADRYEELLARRDAELASHARTIEALRAALEDVCKPIAYLHRKAAAEGKVLNSMATDPSYKLALVMEIARRTLKEHPND